jgi:DNA-directed RNA polymerase specialized sigma24 family protein
MINEVSSSIETQCAKRLDTLYREHHSWLLKVGYNITKNKSESEDLVMELYEYLHRKQNQKLFWGESYNTMYCLSFLKHRWLNKTKKLNRTTYITEYYTNEADEVYDIDRDIAMMNAHTDIMNEIQRLKKTRNFAPAMLWEMYWTSDDTLQSLADKIGISQSTCFIHIKKIRAHLNKTITNPFIP